MGYENIRDTLNKQLDIKIRRNYSDERFTLLPNSCLGTCDRAPALMIDDDLYRNVQPIRLEDILKKYDIVRDRCNLSIKLWNESLNANTINRAYSRPTTAYTERV